jgi:hypothetical protein
VLHRYRSILSLFRVALAIAEHRERTGRLAADLRELEAAFPDGLPVDPLTGAPFPWTLDAGHGRLGPTACPLHGSADRKCSWPTAVEQQLAWKF